MCGLALHTICVCACDFECLCVFPSGPEIVREARLSKHDPLVDLIEAWSSRLSSNLTVVPRGSDRTFASQTKCGSVRSFDRHVLARLDLFLALFDRPYPKVGSGSRCVCACSPSVAHSPTSGFLGLACCPGCSRRTASDVSPDSDSEVDVAAVADAAGSSQVPRWILSVTDPFNESGMHKNIEEMVGRNRSTQEKAKLRDALVSSERGE